MSLQTWAMICMGVVTAFALWRMFHMSKYGTVLTVDRTGFIAGSD